MDYKVSNDFKNRFLRGQVPSDFDAYFLPVNSKFKDVYDEQGIEYFRNAEDLSKVDENAFDYNSFTGDTILSGTYDTYNYTKSISNTDVDEPDYITSANSAAFYELNNIDDESKTTWNSYIDSYGGFFYPRMDSELRYIANVVQDQNTNIAVVLGDSISGVSQTQLKDVYFSIGTSEKPFNGMFDGNYKVISNIQIEADTLHNGLFGVVGKKGIVKNLLIKDKIQFNCGKQLSITHLKSSASDINTSIIGRNYGTIKNIITSANYVFSGFTPEVYTVGNKTDTNKNQIVLYNQANVDEDDYSNSSDSYSDSNFYFMPSWCINSPSNCIPYIGYFCEGIIMTQNNWSTPSNQPQELCDKTYKEWEDGYNYWFGKQKNNGKNVYVDNDYMNLNGAGYENKGYKMQHSIRATYNCGCLIGMNSGNVKDCLINAKIQKVEKLNGNKKATTAFVGFIGGLAGKQARGEVKSVYSKVNFEGDSNGVPTKKMYNAMNVEQPTIYTSTNDWAKNKSNINLTPTNINKVNNGVTIDVVYEIGNDEFEVSFVGDISMFENGGSNHTIQGIPISDYNDTSTKQPLYFNNIPIIKVGYDEYENTYCYTKNDNDNMLMSFDTYDVEGTESGGYYYYYQNLDFKGTLSALNNSTTATFEKFAESNECYGGKVNNVNYILSSGFNIENSYGEYSISEIVNSEKNYVVSATDTIKFIEGEGDDRVISISALNDTEYQTTLDVNMDEKTTYVEELRNFVKEAENLSSDPTIKSLKIRELSGFNVSWVSYSEENDTSIPDDDKHDFPRIKINYEGDYYYQLKSIYTAGGLFGQMHLTDNTNIEDCVGVIDFSQNSNMEFSDCQKIGGMCGILEARSSDVSTIGFSDATTFFTKNNYEFGYKNTTKIKDCEFYCSNDNSDDANSLTNSINGIIGEFRTEKSLMPSMYYMGNGRNDSTGKRIYGNCLMDVPFCRNSNVTAFLYWNLYVDSIRTGKANYGYSANFGYDKNKNIKLKTQNDDKNSKPLLATNFSTNQSIMLFQFINNKTNAKDIKIPLTQTNKMLDNTGKSWCDLDLGYEVIGGDSDSLAVKVMMCRFDSTTESNIMQSSYRIVTEEQDASPMFQYLSAPIHSACFSESSEMIKYGSLSTEPDVIAKGIDIIKNFKFTEYEVDEFFKYTYEITSTPTNNFCRTYNLSFKNDSVKNQMGYYFQDLNVDTIESDVSGFSFSGNSYHLGNTIPSNYIRKTININDVASCSAISCDDFAGVLVLENNTEKKYPIVEFIDFQRTYDLDAQPFILPFESHSTENNITSGLLLEVK